MQVNAEPTYAKASAGKVVNGEYFAICCSSPSAPYLYTLVNAVFPLSTLSPYQIFNLYFLVNLSTFFNLYSLVSPLTRQLVFLPSPYHFFNPFQLKNDW